MSVDDGTPPIAEQHVGPDVFEDCCTWAKLVLSISILAERQSTLVGELIAMAAKSWSARVCLEEVWAFALDDEALRERCVPQGDDYFDAVDRAVTRVEQALGSSHEGQPSRT